MLHIRDFGGRAKEGKVSQINCRPESDEKQKSKVVCVRHGSYLVRFTALLFWREPFSEENSSKAKND